MIVHYSMIVHILSHNHKLSIHSYVSYVYIMGLVN